MVKLGRFSILWIAKNLSCLPVCISKTCSTNKFQGSDVDLMHFTNSTTLVYIVQGFATHQKGALKATFTQTGHKVILGCILTVGNEPLVSYYQPRWVQYFENYKAILLYSTSPHSNAPFQYSLIFYTVNFSWFSRTADCMFKVKSRGNVTL